MKSNMCQYNMAVEESRLRKHENWVKLLYIKSWELDPDSSVIIYLSVDQLGIMFL